MPGRIEGAGRDEDALAMGRQAHEFRNLQLVELPNGDFAQTMVRQFLFASSPGCSTRARPDRATRRSPGSPARR
jgi:1,2-phenylacetyl-CoA epoxidase catalytic subunit